MLRLISATGRDIRNSLRFNSAFIIKSKVTKSYKVINDRINQVNVEIVINYDLAD